MNQRLHSPVRVEFIDGPLVELLEELTWWGPYPSTVPRAFQSDGGSIPAIFWLLVGHPLSNKVLACYLLHDWELKNALPWRDATRRLNARLGALPIDRVRRGLIVGGVTLKGWINRVRG